MTEIVYRAKLVAESVDFYGYTTYAFENLNYDSCENQYVMCVKFPNWNQAPIAIGDIGYLSIRYVREGEDKWFDGKDFNSYRYTDAIFMKFILEKPMVTVGEVILD